MYICTSVDSLLILAIWVSLVEGSSGIWETHFYKLKPAIRLPQTQQLKP